jgi:hypothetical protein
MAEPALRPTSAVPALMVTLGLAAAGWAIAVPQMTGMDMGVATELGSFRSFTVLWVSMMAAMMLPGAAAAALRQPKGSVAVPLFVGSYLLVWMAVGPAVYALYRPHGASVAAVAAIAAGAYELTPAKRRSEVDAASASAPGSSSGCTASAPASD